MKDYLMMVVERNGDKVAIKVFKGAKWRREGKSYFKVTRDVNYISVNVKTGDVYFGYLHDFQKKKCRKSIRRNCFIDDPINILKSRIKNHLNGFIDDAYEITIGAISAFMFEIDKREDFQDLDFNKRLFRFYLKNRNIKYPNNFHVYAKHLHGPEIRKLIKKNDNRLVDAFMIKYNVSGKKLKKALHHCSNVNISLYQTAKNIFGDNWLNQDNDDIILGCLNSNLQISYPWVINEFLSFVSTEELRRVLVHGILHYCGYKDKNEEDENLMRQKEEEK